MIYKEKLLSQIPSPCFVQDEKLLEDNLKHLSQIKAATGIKILLAQKAYSQWQFYPLIAQYLDGAAASSLNEARLAKEHMNKEVHTYSPAFKTSQFEDILEYSDHIVFNSLGQYERFASYVSDFQGQKSFSLRVNPGFSPVQTKMYNPALSGTRFGVTHELLSTIPKGISGLHFHALCENNSFEFEQTLSVFESNFGHLLHRIKQLNVGGGHFITHPKYNTEHLIDVIQGFQKRFPHIQVTMEPGSAIALNTGFLKTTVIDLINSDDVSILIIDASFTAHMPDTLEMPYQPPIQGATIGQIGEYTYKIGGNSCLSGDFLPEYSFDHAVLSGDHLYFLDQMHYTLVKTNFFNGVDHPGIGVIKKDKSFNMLKSFNYQDFEYKLG